MQEGAFSYASLANVGFLEDLYQRYQKDPNSVDPSWRYFFSGMEFSLQQSPIGASQVSSSDIAVFRLITSYRSHGHKKAQIAPLVSKKEKVPELELSYFGLGPQDLNKSFATFGLLEEKIAPLSRIIERLEEIYAGSVGYEFIGLGKEIESWMIQELEMTKKTSFLPEDKLKIWQDLTGAEGFETFIHTKYPGQIRFSIEGGETLIPMINFLLEEAGQLGAQDVVIGMAHRGRLNVLVHVLDKSYTQVFREFEDNVEMEGTGDVKYHKGVHSNIKTRFGHFIEASVAPNPSHLESVDPVVEGQTRARQDLKQDKERTSVIPLLLHGDASLAGQGVIYELLQMGRLEGYTTGGTLHIAVNNHIGYTTLPKDSRSTLYCTDIAKTFGAPVFHLNAEDPKECIRAVKMAVKIRQLFHIDVFLDLNCYRKYGHNEGDEPSFTQPLEYQNIRSRKTIREMFNLELLKEGTLKEEEIVRQGELLKKKLQEAFDEAVAHPRKQIERQDTFDPIKADVPSVSSFSLQKWADAFCSIPREFQLHSKLQKLMSDRLRMLRQETAAIDWGMAEHLAYATLLAEKVHIRLSGQDVGRGTFSHRHAVWVDQETGAPYIPLNHLQEDQAFLTPINSHLSEFAVMGFDLGYSLSYPRSLVLWEAQFGDFANGAQVIIDQYLATSEQKWAHRSGLVLLLPHGYEGKGPEHSSARIERFLQLSAQDNWIIANCSVPAQFYHLLRRQAYLERKRPLVVFTPKALLRAPSCVSSLSDFTEGSFQEVLADPFLTTPTPKHIVFCSGKVFYDLVEERKKRGDTSTLIFRLEQLYPFPQKELEMLLTPYLSTPKFSWVQEEPKNMGAWNYLQLKLQSVCKKPLSYIGREEGASPAVGSYSLHKKQYERFISEVFQ